MLLNSLLASLNARKSLRDQMSGTAVTLPLGQLPTYGRQTTVDQVGSPQPGNFVLITASLQGQISSPYGLEHQDVIEIKQQQVTHL